MKKEKSLLDKPPKSDPAVLANVIRGDTVESLHRGHIVVLDGDGKIVTSAGDPATVTFFRSACKPFQAMPFLATGTADHFGYSDEEVALACASHSGQKRHVELARSMLDKAGLKESDLHCGTHMPFYEKEAHELIRAGHNATQLHNNCSGKHAAMLATAKFIGADLTTYERIDHPVQQQILKTISLFSECPVKEISVGIDGCSAPNFAMPLLAMANSFVNLISRPGKFGTDKDAVARRVVSAIIDFPELIGGTDRLDTMLMRAGGKKFISKVGADGVWLCGVLPTERYRSGLGIALKIEDGDDFISRPVVVIEILRQLGVLDKNAFTETSPLPILNRRRDIVGRVVPTFRLPT